MEHLSQLGNQYWYVIMYWFLISPGFLLFVGDCSILGISPVFTYYYFKFSKSVIFNKPTYCPSSGWPICSWWCFTFKDPKCNQVPVFLSAPEILRDQGQMHWVVFQFQDQEIANEKRHFHNHPTQSMYFTERGGKGGPWKWGDSPKVTHCWWQGLDGSPAS